MRQDEVLFESAIEAIHADRPTSDQLAASADSCRAMQALFLIRHCA